MKHLNRLFCAGIMSAVFASDLAYAQQPARLEFGGKAEPAAMNAQAIGFYNKGCLAGGVAIPVDGPNWQAMRLSRNRRWGHPDLIATIEDLSIRGKQDGWNGLLVGDISQPRGGPMLTGHRSHQIGLDADIWFVQMPNKRMTYQERESISSVSVLKNGTNQVDKSRWTRAHTMLLYHAAKYKNIERVLVHPGVKKQLCDTVKGDRSWLSKIRPVRGHHYHFHLRMKCPVVSANCKPQSPPPNKTGCNDGSLEWWFAEGLKPRKPSKTKPKPRREMQVSDLPNSCSTVLRASAKSRDSAVYKPVKAQGFSAPAINIPEFSVAKVLKGRNIESKGKSVKQLANTINAAIIRAPIPTPRPR